MMADSTLRWGRPKNASAPPWRAQAEEAPPWRRRKERSLVVPQTDMRNETPVSVQQGGSSASDRRRSPSQDKKLGGLSQAETPEAKAADASTVDTLKATDASEALKATFKAADASADASRVFEIGEKVRYWSGTHRKWVEAHVLQISRGPDGELTSYDLTAKAQADISRVKDHSTAEDAPPPATPVPEKGNAEEQKVMPDLPKFEKDAEVQYFSETRERWIDVTVEERHEKDGVVTYDLNCKKGVAADRLRSSKVEYAVGEQVEYWSASSHRWMPAIVERLHPEAKTCDLSVKPGAALSKVRKMPGTAVPQVKAVRAISMSYGVGVPPPPLACSFKAGDQVQYFSESKQRWMETTVMRMFEMDGNICYDLECKRGVSADKVRASPRASQERYEVGEAVEYWSSSAGRWVSAKVTKAQPDVGQCDLDIKLAAPIGRLRRPLAPEFVKPSPPEMLPLPPAPKSPETPAPRVPKPLPRPLQAPPTRPPVHRPEPEMEPAAAKEDSPQGPPAKEQDIKVIGETETKDVEMPSFPTARPAVQLAEQPMPESEVEEIKVSEKERQETREEEEKVHEIVDEEVDYEDDEEKEESEKEEAEVEDVIAENGDAEPQVPEQPEMQVVEKQKKSKRRRHSKERHRRRRKERTAEATGLEEQQEPRPEPNGDRGRRRRRQAPDPSGLGYVEPDVQPPSRRRRLEPPDEAPKDARAPGWGAADHGGRRAPPGATAKAVARPMQRDVRDRDSSRGVCDLLGAAKDAVTAVDWHSLAVEQAQAMERDKDVRQRRQSASPLRRKKPLQPLPRRGRDADGRDVRLISRERETSRSRRRRRQNWGHR